MQQYPWGHKMSLTDIGTQPQPRALSDASVLMNRCCFTFSSRVAKSGPFSPCFTKYAYCMKFTVLSSYSAHFPDKCGNYPETEGSAEDTAGQAAAHNCPGKCRCPTCDGRGCAKTRGLQADRSGRSSAPALSHLRWSLHAPWKFGPVFCGEVR